MKITEILVENQNLEEGPILNKIGSAVGKVAGTVAKGVGAVAGGVAGLGSAVKKGFQAGKSTVAGAGDDATAPAATGAPTTPAAKTKTGAATSAPSTAPATTNTPPVSGKTPNAPASAPASTGAAPAGEAPAAGGTAYAQVKANIDKLDKKGKQRILATLQKEVGAAPAAPAKPAAGATPAAGGTAAPAAGAAPAKPAKPAAGGGAMANMANQLTGNKPNTMANTPVSATNASAPAAGSPPKKPNLRTPMALQQKPPAAPADDEQNYDTQTGVASPAQMQRNRATAEKEAPYGFDIKTGKPNPKPAAEPGATTTTPSGEKVLANPVATVGTKRATNIGQSTFDTQTGKALPGQALNAIRKKAEYGTGALGAARKRNKAGATAPAAQESIDADRTRIMGTSQPTNIREKVSESFSLFRKR